MKRYNKFLKKFVELKEGERYCSACNGAGKILVKRENSKGPIALQCSKCLGTGKLDWVEEAVGKRGFSGTDQAPP